MIIVKLIFRIKYEKSFKTMIAADQRSVDPLHISHRFMKYNNEAFVNCELHKKHLKNHEMILNVKNV